MSILAKIALVALITTSGLGSAQTQAIKPVIETKGSNPPTVKTANLAKIFERFKARYIETRSAFDKVTHESFHGKFSDYFSRLPEDVHAKLVSDYSLVFAEDKKSLRTSFTYEEVFQLGNQPPELLFPLCYIDDVVTFSELKGLILRGKEGKERGTFLDVSDINSSFNYILVRFTTPQGGTKELSSGTNALTVLWSDLKDKTLIFIPQISR